MNKILQMRTRFGIKAQTEDYTDDGVDKPYRMTAFIPTENGKPKFRAIQFAFASMQDANTVLFNLTHGGGRFRDYTSKLIEPENERYIRNL